MVCFCQLLVSNTLDRSYSTFSNPPFGQWCIYIVLFEPNNFILHRFIYFIRISLFLFCAGLCLHYLFFLISSLLTFDIFFKDVFVNSLARRRWMLFYTLLRNPHLLLLRKHHLSSSSSQQTSSSPQSDTVLQALVMASRAQSCQAKSQSPEITRPPEIEVIPAEDC